MCREGQGAAWHRNRPAPAATRPRTRIPPVVSPPGPATRAPRCRGSLARQPPGAPATQRLRAPAFPLSSAHPARPPGRPGAEGPSRASRQAPRQHSASAPPHSPCRQPTRPGHPGAPGIDRPRARRPMLWGAVRRPRASSCASPLCSPHPRTDPPGAFAKPEKSS